jgi:mono/diheme cytochrome c family protein
MTSHNKRENGMRIHHILVVAALAGAVLACASAGAAAQAPAAPNDAATRGKAIFLNSCAVCHGDKGRGDGPAARALKPGPADLSRLTVRYGVFPAAKVTSTLNGTATVIAHGNPGMMIWQAIFNADAGNQADARIADVVKYIESIQRK